MDRFGAVNSYCEKADPGFRSEPVKALTDEAILGGLIAVPARHGRCAMAGEGQAAFAAMRGARCARVFWFGARLLARADCSPGFVSV